MSLDLLTDAERRLVEAHKPNDFVARFIKWAEMKTDAPAYTLQAAALMALSLAAGDTTVMPPIFGGSPTYLNLYIMVVGPSTTMRKTTVLNFIRGLLPKNQQTRADYIKFLDDVSIQAFNKTAAKAGLEMAPVLLSVDEVAGLFGLVRKRDSYLSGFDKTLMKAYDHSPISILRVNANIDSETGAYVGVFAASTPEPLMEVLDGNDVESGLLPRFIIIDARNAIRGHRRHLSERMDKHDEWLELQAKLQEFLYGIAKPRADNIPEGAWEEGGPINFPITTLPIQPEALNRLDAIDAIFDKEAGQDSSAWGAIKGRAFWHIIKLAGLFALARHGAKAKVELIDVLRAVWLVEQTVADLAIMQDEVGANATERQVKAVLDLLASTRAGRMKQSNIARRMSLTGRDLRDLLATLMLRDLITLDKDASGAPFWTRSKT